MPDEPEKQSDNTPSDNSPRKGKRPRITRNIKTFEGVKYEKVSKHLGKKRE